MAEKRYHKFEHDLRGIRKAEPEFPNLKAMREFDERAHEERAKEAGLSPEQAKEHAKEDVRSGEADRKRD